MHLNVQAVINEDASGDVNGLRQQIQLLKVSMILESWYLMCSSVEGWA